MLNFNNKAIPSFVKIKRVDISALPSLNVGIVGNSDYGVFLGKTKIKEKEINVSVSIVPPAGKSLYQCERELGAFLSADSFGLCPLYFTDDASIRYMAKVTKADIKDLVFAGEGTISFIVPSGCSESSNSTPVSGTGKVIANYMGSVRSLPKVKIIVNTAITNLTVSNVESADSITLIGKFKAGDIIEIDSSKRLVKVNDILHIDMISINSKFITLKQGTNTINCSGSGCTVWVEYRTRFL